MSTPTNARTDKEARDAILAGFDAVADPVKATYGAAGANVAIEVPLYPFHRVTNDGVTVAQSIEPEDPYEAIGANLAKEIATRADKESGDGTTTATILAQAIMHAGNDSKEAPMALKRSLDETVPIVEAAIDAQKRDITVDEVGKVALSSSEDQEMADILQRAYQEIGPTGIVEMDNSNLAETFYEVVDGVRLRGAGYMGQWSSTEPGKAVFTRPKILISRDKITSADQIEPIVAAVAKAGQDQLVIYCDEMDVSVAGRLALTHLNGGFKTLVIQSPTLWKDWYFEDLAMLTGAVAVDSTAGKTFRNLVMSDLGSCEKVITTKDETRIIGTRDISAHVAMLMEEGLKDDQQKMRALWLQTKMAVLKVGARSESELSYRRLKAIDAINACHLALEDGVVPGGGIALLNCSGKMPNTPGGMIMEIALVAPVLQIMKNYGEDVSKPGSTFFGFDNLKDHGFDAKTGEIVDMWDAGILDPAKVVKNAVRSAVSTAGTALTTRVLVRMTDRQKAMNRGV